MITFKLLANLYIVKKIIKEICKNIVNISLKEFNLKLN